MASRWPRRSPATTGGSRRWGRAISGPGTYRVVFGTGTYFARTGQQAFYPEVTVSFLVGDAGGHYHVPLVLSPFAYATYRGN